MVAEVCSDGRQRGCSTGGRSADVWLRLFDPLKLLLKKSHNKSKATGSAFEKLAL